VGRVRAQDLFRILVLCLTLTSCGQANVQSAAPRQPLAETPASDTQRQAADLPFPQSLEQLKKPEVLYRERLSYAELLLKHLKNNAQHDLTENLIYKKSTQQVDRAQLAHQRGALPESLRELDSAIVALETLSTQRPVQQRQQQRYQSLKDGLPYFYSAYQRNYQRVLEEEGEQATSGYNKARVDMLVSESEQLAAHTRFGEAAVLLNEAQSLIAEAIRGMLNHHKLGTFAHVAEQDRSHLGKSKLQREREAYQAAQNSLDAFVAAAKRVAARESSLFDGDLMDWLVAEAKQFAEQQRYSEAEAILHQVRSLVTKGLKEELDGQSIVIKVDVSTPELEYRYERNRYLGYEELISVAIKQMRPEKETVLLINQYADQGRWMAQQADKQQQNGALPVAIRMIQDATRVIQQALKAAGVPIYNSPIRE